MKTFLTLAITFICFQANALWFKITNTSFNETDTIFQGSTQYLDAQAMGTWTSADRVRIILYHITSDGRYTDTTEVLNEQFSTYYLELPKNPDESRRLYFKIPTDFKGGKFMVRLRLDDFNKPTGILSTSVVSGIKSAKTEELKPFYYNLNGIQVTPTTGFYIRVTGIKSEQVYIMEHE